MTSTRCYAHHALVYESTEDLLGAAVPYLTAGLDAGDEVVLACRSHIARELVAGVGREAGAGREAGIRLQDPEDVLAGPARAIAAVRRLAAESAGRPVRVLCDMSVRVSPHTWLEWCRYEAVTNVALAPLRLAGVCAYDGRLLSAPEQRAICWTHPLLLTSGGAAENPAFVEPATFLRTLKPTPDPVEQTAPDLTVPVEDVYDLSAAREALQHTLQHAGINDLAATDFTAAVGELLANALQHGRPSRAARLWVREDRLVCEVRDGGPGFDDPLAGYLPPSTDTEARRTGAGLWLARQTCDRIDGLHRSEGFTMRATMFLERRSEQTVVAGATARAEAARYRAQAARARASRIVEQFNQHRQSIDARERSRPGAGRFGAFPDRNADSPERAD